MKKILALLIMAVFILAGCGSSASDEEVVVEFTTFSVTPEQEPVLQEIITMFEEENPGITVEYNIVGYDDYFTKLQSDLAAGTAADVFEINYENAVMFYENGVLEDLTPYISDPSVYDQTAYEAYGSDGVQYGLPISFSTVVLYYNKDMFDECGVAYPTSDWTWEDEEQAAKDIQACKPDVYGSLTPFTFNEFYKNVAQNGGALFSEDYSEVTINTPENLEALQVMYEQVNVDQITPQSLEPGQDTELFMSGQAGMITTGTWMFSTFADAPFEWGIAVEPGNTQDATHFFANAVVMNADSENKDAAYKWMEFYSSDPEVQKMKVEANWETPAVSDQSVKDAYLAQSTGEDRNVVYESLEHGVTPPTPSGVSSQEMSDIINGYLDEVKLEMITPEEALIEMQKEIEALF